jgi:hypothetical protein
VAKLADSPGVLKKFNWQSGAFRAGLRLTITGYAEIRALALAEHLPNPG